MLVDADLFLLLHSFAGRSLFFDTLSIFFAEYLAFILVALFLFLILFSNRSKRERVYILLVATISTAIARGLVVELIRFFYHRPRPYLTFHLQPLIAENSYSFPSAHAAFFFALSTAVYMYNKTWGVVFFAASTLMCIARVISGVHYPSDITSGMIVGIGVVYLAVQFGGPQLEKLTSKYI